MAVEGLGTWIERPGAIAAGSGALALLGIVLLVLLGLTIISATSNAR